MDREADWTQVKIIFMSWNIMQRSGPRTQHKGKDRKYKGKFRDIGNRFTYF